MQELNQKTSISWDSMPWQQHPHAQLEHTRHVAPGEAELRLGYTEKPPTRYTWLQHIYDPNTSKPNSSPQPHKKLNESHKPFDFSTQNMIMGREKIYNYLQAEKNRRLVSDPNTFYVLKHMELR